MRESFNLPSFTSRFSAVESSPSNIGLNWFTLISNGRLTITTMSAATEMPTHFTIRRIAELHPYRVYSCVSGIRLRLVHPSRARLLLVGHALACQRPLAGAFFPSLWHGYFYGRGAGTLVPRLVHGGNLVAVGLAVFHLAIRIAGRSEERRVGKDSRTLRGR